MSEDTSFACRIVTVRLTWKGSILVKVQNHSLSSKSERPHVFQDEHVSSASNGNC